VPFYLDEVDLAAEVEDINSVLIVPCRFCPAASLAVKNDEPYLEPLRRGLRTSSYERFVEKVRGGFERRGIRADVFRTSLPHQFVLCMWSARRRQQLAERAQDYEAVLVLGCEGAVQTVRNALGSVDCRVIQGMECHGLMSVKPSLSFPGRLSLELDSVNPRLRLEGPSSLTMGLPPTSKKSSVRDVDLGR
jgi:hypothetical protein